MQKRNRNDNHFYVWYILLWYQYGPVVFGKCIRFFFHLIHLLVDCLKTTENLVVNLSYENLLIDLVTMNPKSKAFHKSCPITRIYQSYRGWSNKLLSITLVGEETSEKMSRRRSSLIDLRISSCMISNLYQEDSYKALNNYDVQHLQNDAVLSKKEQM